MKNTFGLDASYFQKKLEAILAGVDLYTPLELARELARLSRSADPTVLAEPEFAHRCSCVPLSELSEFALNFWVAMVKGASVDSLSSEQGVISHEGHKLFVDGAEFRPVHDLGQGAPLMISMGVTTSELSDEEGPRYCAKLCKPGRVAFAHGATELEAAMRVIVASVYGYVLPDILVHGMEKASALAVRSF